MAVLDVQYDRFGCAIWPFWTCNIAVLDMQYNVRGVHTGVVEETPRTSVQCDQ